MKFNRLLFLISLIFCGEGAWSLSAVHPIVGSWKFYKILYEGVERPPFNPRLHLYFSFTAEGHSRLFYFRDNEKGFCERRGRYQVNGAHLVDHVTWVNPKNAMECGRDPDMQMGQTTTTPIAFVDGDLHLFLKLKGEDLIYIWKQVFEE